MKNESNLMNAESNMQNIFGWIFGMAVLATGILNMVLVHLVPGIAYLLLSLVYFPPANTYLKIRSGISIPLIVKFILAIFIFMFTLGVSDLGDMID
jgi:hypothetical protein